MKVLRNILLIMLCACMLLPLAGCKGDTNLWDIVPDDCDPFLCTAPPVAAGDDEALIKRLLYEAQVITNFTRDNNFGYGDARINPAVNWEHLSVDKAIDPNERLVSCDRLVSWILCRAGFTDYQNYLKGADMMAIFDECNFEKITDVENLRAGDIVFIDTNGLPGDDHVFLCASKNLGNNVYLRFDHGSDARIQCNKGTEVTPGQQPFKEEITGFLFAYRPNASNMPTKKPATPIPTLVPTPKPTPKPDNIVEVSVPALSNSQPFFAGGYKKNVIMITSEKGTSISNHDLSKYCSIIICYGADPNADISTHKIYLKDSSGNEIASGTLKRSNGAFWASGTRQVELTFDSSYNGELFIGKDSPSHSVAVSEIYFKLK